MKKLKFILCVGILGVMTYGGITAYNHLTMTEQERLLLANVEALTSGETGGTQYETCYAYQVLNFFSDIYVCEGQQIGDPIRECYLMAWAAGNDSYKRKCIKK